MQYTNMGRTGLSVSRLCLGTMNFGWKTSQDDSFAIMDSAHDKGLNFFDTANVYGQKEGEGITEKIIGKWFAQDEARRKKTVLASKVHFDMGQWPNQSKLSALHIRHACDESLQRLGTDYIDLYYMHHIWREGNWDEIWQAMEQLIRQGKILYVASSNFAAWHIMQANNVAQKRNLLGLVAEQSIYNLINRTVELEVLPACQANGIAFMPWAPLAGASLAGTKGKEKQGRRSLEVVQERVASHQKGIDAFESLCDELGQTPAAVALAWLLHQSAVTSPIIGPRTPQQFDNCIGALDISLSKETLDRIDEIFPGPGAPAPEAYCGF